MTARKRVGPQLAFGSLPSVALPAQLLHAGADRGEVISSTAPVAQLLHAGFDGRKIVGSAGSVHGVSSIFIVALTLAIGPVAARAGATFNIGVRPAEGSFHGGGR
jgi:hypothetical protein